MLEQNIEKADKDLLERIKTNVKKKIYLTTAILVLGAAYFSGYSSGCTHEQSECCEELDCNKFSYGSKTCDCTESSPHKAQKCITNSDGLEECCRCDCYHVVDK